jgi:hypothetical protein
MVSPDKLHLSNMLYRAGGGHVRNGIVPCVDDTLLDGVHCLYGPEARVVAETSRHSSYIGRSGLGFFFSERAPWNCRRLNDL